MIPAIALERALSNGGDTAPRSAEGNDRDGAAEFSTLLDQLAPPAGADVRNGDSEVLAELTAELERRGVESLPLLPESARPEAGFADEADLATAQATLDSGASAMPPTSNAASTRDAEAAANAGAAQFPMLAASDALGSPRQLAVQAKNGSEPALPAPDPTAAVRPGALRGSDTAWTEPSEADPGVIDSAPQRRGEGLPMSPPDEHPPALAQTSPGGATTALGSTNARDPRISDGTAAASSNARMATVDGGAVDMGGAEASAAATERSSDMPLAGSGLGRHDPVDERAGATALAPIQSPMSGAPTGMVESIRARFAEQTATSGEELPAAGHTTPRDPVATITLTQVRAVLQRASPAEASATTAAGEHSGNALGDGPTAPPALATASNPNFALPAQPGEQTAGNEPAIANAGASARAVAQAPPTPSMPLVAEPEGRQPASSTTSHRSAVGPEPTGVETPLGTTPPPSSESEAARRLVESRPDPADGARATVAADAPGRGVAAEGLEVPRESVRPTIEVRADGSGLPMAPASANTTQPVTPFDAVSSAFSAPRPAAADAVAHHAALLTTNGGGRALIRLNPPELGQVEISVRVHGSTVDVSVRAEESTAVAALTDGRERLAEALSTRELRIENFEVSGPEGRAPSNSHDQGSAHADRNAGAGADTNEGEHRGTDPSAREGGAVTGLEEADAGFATQAPNGDRAQIDVHV